MALAEMNMGVGSGIFTQEYIDTELPKKVRTSAGYGKKKYEFETDFGTVTIFADNPNSAQKKLKTLNAENKAASIYL